MTAPTTTVSIDEYINTSEWDGYELDDGVPVKVPMSTLSAWVGGEIFRRLANEAQTAGGHVFPQDTALRAWPARPRRFWKPDAMYFAPGVLPPENPLANPLERAPSLVVEVISPTEIGSRIEQKNIEYLDVGVRLLWVVYPATQTVHIYRPGGSATILGTEDTLDGEDILPGFRVPIADLFPPMPAGDGS
jgi:Uma2 family endonuclease